MCLPCARIVMNIPQKPLNATTTAKSIPKYQISILSQILKTFSQSHSSRVRQIHLVDQWPVTIEKLAFPIFWNHQKRFSILQTCPSISVKPNFPFTLEERWICNDKESLHRMKRKNSPFCVFLLLSTFLGTFLVIFSFRHSKPSLWVPGCVIMIK